jgi:hypothetical protein
MAIYPQPNPWQCGPFALKYALLLLGIPGNEREIARLAGTDESGTDEVELARAARKYGCDLQLVRREDPETARRELRLLLHDRIPVLLCVHGWDHWITAADEDDDQFVILDSRDSAVLTVVPWDRLREMLVYRDRSHGANAPTLYDLHPVVPHRRTVTRAKFSVARVRHLLAPANRSLATAWDRYLEDVLAICDVPSAQCTLTLALSDVVLRFEQEILSRADSAVGTVDSAVRRRILDHMRFVAETYELQVPVGDEQRVVDHVSAILGRRAAAAFV